MYCTIQIFTDTKHKEDIKDGWEISTSEAERLKYRYFVAIKGARWYNLL